MAKKTAKKAAKKATKKKLVKKKAAQRTAQARQPLERRSDFGAPVSVFFDKLPAWQRETALTVHKLLLEHAPDLEHRVKWGLAHYLFPGGKMKDAEGFAIYASDKSVNLAVGRGGELAKKHPLLEGTGKSMRHVKLRSVADAKSAAVAAIVKDAVELVSTGG